MRAFARVCACVCLFLYEEVENETNGHFVQNMCSPRSDRACIKIEAKHFRSKYESTEREKLVKLIFLLKVLGAADTPLEKIEFEVSLRGRTILIDGMFGLLFSKKMLFADSIAKK